jgi:predicted RNase H-like nuclease
MNCIGVDGCKKGWFYVSLDDRDHWKTGVTPNIQHLIDRFQEAHLILVDIPIGLREKGKLERLCDKEARKILGPKRGTSVFPAPCREAVYASSREKAKRINKELTGRSLSEQSLAISPKICEVDCLLTASEAARRLVREVHPEVCFWGLNGGKSMTYSKKTLEGFVERLGVLRKVYGECEECVKEALVKHKRQDVAKDDILDALAAAITARFGFHALKTLPEAPEKDAKDLPMEMVYYNPHLS